MKDWQPIETAPKVKFGEAPIDVVLYGPGIGVKTGRACAYPDGFVFAGVSFINGNLVQDGYCTHWMPLPAPPPETEA